MLRVAVAGVGGRMGRALVEACCDAADVTLAAALARPGSAVVGRDAGELAGRAAVGITVTDDAAAAVEACDVLVDFTTPEASALHAELCGPAGRAMVIGTTGLDSDQRGRVEAAAASVPVVLAPNMSVGVNLCLRLIEMAAGVLGEDVDVEITEAHHRHKVDAPSGTALRMGDVVARTLGRSLNECAVYGRQGRTGTRDRAAIGFSVVRAGDIVGEHTVLFAGDGERVEISHKASSRTTFAGGAVRAARWVVGRPPGLYEMADVLGL